jgi:23S rRNA (adenine2503-C2)-methyltransferase
LVLANEILKPENRRVSNIVFMGMGEPLDNYDNSIAAANRMISPDAYGLSARHVTISTSGIAPKIVSMAKDTRASLAVSLHAATENLRTELMPINRRYGLEELYQAIKYFQDNTNRRVTIEYIMISNVNVKTEDARALVRFLQGISAKVNLIPFNAHPGLPYQRPSDDEIRSFQKFLADRSIPAPVRYSRGLDVSAACGQLAAKNIETLSSQPQRKSVLAAADSVGYSSGSCSSSSDSLGSVSN